MFGKSLGLSTLVSLSFGLMAGCSDDSTSNSGAPVDSYLGQQELLSSGNENTKTNVCIEDSYTAMQGANGIILCMDANGTLVFWINADGTYSFPESTNSDTANQDTIVGTSSNSAPTDNDTLATLPTDPASSSSIINSSASANCTTSTPLYTISGISYYQDNTGAIFYYDANCNKVLLNTITSSSSETTLSSSSEIFAISSSSIVIESSATAQSSASIVTPSNGDTPSITYSTSGAAVANNNNCVTVTGGEVVITCAGDYDFSGSYSGADAQIRVYSPKSDSGVYLNLRGLTLTNTADAPIYSQMSSKTFVVPKNGTTNTLSDGSTRTKTYTYVNSNNETKVDTTGACIYAKDDLTIKGEGTLIVKGNYNNGIHTSNDLRFRGATTVNVTAVNNGLKGKGTVDIENGNITIAAANGDGIKSDEGEDDSSIVSNKGIVNIKGGNITITKAGDDGIQAYNYIIIQDSVSEPTIKVTSTGKGIVSDNRVYINAGKIDISSGDDGVHSNLNVYFNGGYTTIAAPKNDGVHADSTLMINDGTIYVTNSYEGLEAWYIKANGGITDVYGTDDAWNAAGGNDGSGNTNQSGQSNWGFGPGGGMGGRMGNSSGFLTITGGVHHAKTGSGDTDGIDSNGELTISGGVVIVECQISGGMGGSFDADGTASLTSKTVLGFSSGSSEKGSNYNVSFSTSSYYGTSNVAFKPTISGRYMVATTGQPAQVSNTSSYQKSVTFPSGSTVYYNN